LATREIPAFHPRKEPIQSGLLIKLRELQVEANFYKHFAPRLHDAGISVVCPFDVQIAVNDLLVSDWKITTLLPSFPSLPLQQLSPKEVDSCLLFLARLHAFFWDELLLQDVKAKLWSPGAQWVRENWNFQVSAPMFSTALERFSFSFYVAPTLLD